jgi:hypothetical protein
MLPRIRAQVGTASGDPVAAQAPLQGDGPPPAHHLAVLRERYGIRSARPSPAGI